MRNIFLFSVLTCIVAVCTILFFPHRLFSEDNLRIAFCGPLSGPNAGDGSAMLRSVQLLVQEFQNKGGIAGREVILDTYDDQNNPAVAADLARTIAADRRILAVIGHQSSDCSIAAGEIYKQAGIPAITPTATNIHVTKDNEWYFRLIYNDDFQGRFLVTYAATVLDAKLVHIIYDDRAYGRDLAEVMTAAARKRGLNLGVVRNLEIDGSSLPEQNEAVATELRSQSGVILLAMSPAAAARFVKSARDSDIDNKILAPDAVTTKTFLEAFTDSALEQEIPGYYSNGILAATPLLFDIMNEQTQDFQAAYLDVHGVEPGPAAVFAYDAAKVLLHCLERTVDSGGERESTDLRSGIKANLAALNSHSAVEGITGPIYFDADGDAIKSIFIGQYRSRQLISAFTQLQHIPEPEAFSARKDEFDPERLLHIEGYPFYRQDVVRVGTRAESFSDLNLNELNFELDLYLWFRYQGNLDVTDIEFLNVLEPFELGEPVEQLQRDNKNYLLYKITGRFEADYHRAPYGQHVLSLSFRHKNLTLNNMIFALDMLAMRDRPDMTEAQRLQRAQELISSSGWELRRGFFFQDIVEQHALGHPDYLLGRNHISEYSRFNIGVFIQRPVFTLRGMLSTGYALSFFIASFLLFIGATVFDRTHSGRRFAKVIWPIYVVVTFLLLISTETLLGNWLSVRVTRYYLELLDRTFDLLWWIVPAFLLNGAVRHFVWQPLERSTNQTVPTLLRNFVTFIIYLLALFGITAFVFDQKLTSLLATSGVIAMIIGLAIQINISNIFSGIALNIERPFRIGDWIHLHGRSPDLKDGIIGFVQDIGWRTTRLKTIENNIVIIPNSVVSEKTVTNFMLPDEISRFEESYYIDVSVPSDRVINVLSEAVAPLVSPDGTALLAEPPFKIRIKGTTPMGVEYVVHYFTIPRKVTPAKGRHLVNTAVIDALNKAGIAYSYPKTELIPTAGAAYRSND